MNPLIESLSKCRIDGNIVSLPDINSFKLTNYADVRKALINAGAKYKKNTFVFPSEAQPFMNKLLNGESVNIKQEYQFFPTPDDIADWIVIQANIVETDIVLEPSAGQGALVKAINRQFPAMKIGCIELMDANREILSKMPTVQLFTPEGNDFLSQDVTNNFKDTFDKIVANPPFSNNQDIDHIRQMYYCLKNNGRLVSIASKHWEISGNKKEAEFKQWLNDIGAGIYPIERGKFKSSGTLIACNIIEIIK